MKNKKIGIIFYTIAFFFLIVYLCIEFLYGSISPLIRINILLVSACFMEYGCGKISNTKDEYIKNKKIYLFILLIMYFILLFSLTLFDTYFNRELTSLFEIDKDNISDYISSFINYIPFNTIKLYFNGVTKGYLSKNLFLYNVFGNFIALMPLSYLLPRISDKYKSILKFIFFICLVILFIEIVQFITLCGSCDIDDFILNMSGALIAYNIFNRGLRK